MLIQELIHKIKEDPTQISFTEVIAVIDENYDFTPTAFKNGDCVNEAGQNSGSCKIMAFSVLNQLNKEETLACFGAYYRIDVLENPEADTHQNIRNFIKYGREGLKIEGEALRLKAKI